MIVSLKEMFLARLRASCGEITFTYGLPTISGDVDCALLLAVELDEEGQPIYLATITGPHLPGREAEGLEWCVVDDRGRTLHTGKTGRRGQFQFLIDRALAERMSPPTCYLRFNPEWFEGQSCHHAPP